MLGRSHAAVAAASWVTVVAASGRAGAPVDLVGFALSTAAATSAGLAPDIDEPGSTVARNLGHLGRVLAWGVRKVARGHRGLTHSIGGVAIAAGLTALASTHPVALALLLGVLVATALDVMPGVSERIEWLVAAAVALASARLTVGMSPLLMPAAVAWGWHVHLICDRCTKQPIPYAWPLRPDTHRKAWGWFRTGSAAEGWVVNCAVVVCGIAALAVR